MTTRITAQNVHQIKRRLGAAQLRRVLAESGRKYCCEKCNCAGVWQDEPLRLQVDHVNGDPEDHNLENLRYLCPNCHSQTKTHSFKGRKHSEEARRKMSMKASKPRPNQYASHRGGTVDTPA